MCHNHKRDVTVVSKCDSSQEAVNGFRKISELLWEV